MQYVNKLVILIVDNGVYWLGPFNSPAIGYFATVGTIVSKNKGGGEEEIRKFQFQSKWCIIHNTVLTSRKSGKIFFYIKKNNLILHDKKWIDF